MGSFILAGLMEWNVQYLSKSWLERKARSLNTASAPVRLQRAPVTSMRSFTKCRHAPSITPVAMGKPWAKAVIIPEIGGMIGQVARASIHVFTCIGAEATSCGTATHSACHQTGLSSKHFKQTRISL
ncbi:MAG: hypothetical protein JRJ65_04740 [Deltaproteobacteria bacterium]|nr:hypothetical protein [Deltaproteobacteria bacterium]